MSADEPWFPTILFGPGLYPVGREQPGVQGVAVYGVPDGLPRTLTGKVLRGDLR
jgi:hypothetical protein